MSEINESHVAAKSPAAHSLSQSTFRLSDLAWVKGFKKEMGGADGWKRVGESLVGLSVIWGVLIGVMTYQSQHLLERRDRAERSYYQLIADLGHTSSGVRIGAVSRIPEVMLRRVPKAEDITVTEAVRLTFGGQIKTIPAYHRDIQRLIKLQLSALNAHNKDWSAQEVQAMLDMLGGLGPEGWYDARPTATHPDATESLAWIWQHKSQFSEIESPSTLLKGVRLDGISFQQFNLSGADFTSASLVGANLRYTKLDRCQMQNANLTNADLSLASLKYGQLDHADLTHVYLASATVDSASLRYTTLKEAQLPEIKCANCDFLESILSHANLRKAYLHSANLQNSTIDHAYAAQSDLSNADFSFSVLSGTDFSQSDLRNANLRHADLHGANLQAVLLAGANFAGADLTGANLLNVKDLTLGRDWLDANIAGVKGVSEAEVRQLLERGAISIADGESWKRYKELGRPHAHWREFVKP